MSCATPILPSGPLGHVPEMTGHVAEIAGHDPETAGHVRPKYAIGIAGAAVWCNFDLAWKVSEWPTTHDTFGVVLAHLLASATTLMVCSVAGGAAVRRCAWLQPRGT
ncbi:hypothetical protein IMT09_02715 [Burkholderia cepacia]|nr:hypothetical protein [Burkholderia cepacia]